MPLAFLDALTGMDAIASVLWWFTDGILWLFSPDRRAKVRARWAERGRLYKYGQILSWWLVLFIVTVITLFIAAAFVVR